MNWPDFKHLSPFVNLTIAANSLLMAKVPEGAHVDRQAPGTYTCDFLQLEKQAVA